MTNKELEQKLNQLTDTVNNLVKGLSSAVEEERTEAGNGTVPLTLETRINRRLGGGSDPVPVNYRKLVSEYLSSDFGIHVKAQAGIPAFKFTVIVPSKYSAEKDYNLYPDVRPKVITYAEAENGVRDWCEMVFKNFDEVTRQKIVASRNVINSTTA